MRLLRQALELRASKAEEQLGKLKEELEAEEERRIVAEEARDEAEEGRRVAEEGMEAMVDAKRQTVKNLTESLLASEEQRKRLVAVLRSVNGDQNQSVWGTIMSFFDANKA
ncbi:unnamed protein product [Closterium sp. Naga37s-1]|nr:unnamed protein product [Closterium sp. Naga37s-1]